MPGGGRGAEKHYRVMTLSDIIRMPLPPIADDAVLFFWRVSSMVPEAYEVIRAWGFVGKSEIVWNKTDGNGNLSLGMGRIVRGSHETCIVATRGKGIEPISKSEKTSFLAPRGKHSEKPEEFFRIVERLYPLELWPEAHVELFARKRRPGWIAFGDELPPEEIDPRVAAIHGWPCLICNGTGETASTSGEPMICPVRDEAWHRAPMVAVPVPAMPPRPLEIPEAWLSRANDYVEPPPKRNGGTTMGSWKKVKASVAELRAAEAHAIVHGAMLPGAHNIAPPARRPEPTAMPENLGALVRKLADRGFDVPLTDLSAMSPLHRSVALAFADQDGDDPPEFLELYAREAF